LQFVDEKGNIVDFEGKPLPVEEELEDADKEPVFLEG
jgi:hypothetical protein